MFKMGIHGLTEYLKKEAPEYIQQVDVKALEIRRVALDGHQWMTMATKKIISDAYAEAVDPWQELSDLAMMACRQQWLRQALQTTCSWLDLGLEPVWVFDGPAPAAKAARKAERADAREKAAQRLVELRTASSSASKVQGDWMVPVNDSELRAKIVSLRQQLVSLQPGWQDALVDVLSAAGVPWVLGATEGEKVACALWKAGKVDAVVSNDTDCLVYGCDRVIISPKALRVDGQVLMSFYARPYILEFLEMTDEQFTEFCIACGCDYNTNIPKVGPVKVHDLMSTHGTLAEWPATYKNIPLDQTYLNVSECKRLFSFGTLQQCIEKQSPTLAFNWSAWQRCDDALVRLLGSSSATFSLLSTLGYYPRR
jgi:5'-3' exonuclease